MKLLTKRERAEAERGILERSDSHAGNATGMVTAAMHVARCILHLAATIDACTPAELKEQGRE